MEKSWIQKAIDWKATPTDLREPKTVQGFIKKHNIPESTFYYEISKPDIEKRIINKCLHRAKDLTPDILGKLGEKAKKGSERSIEMYLKFILELKEKFGIDIDEKGKKRVENLLKKHNDNIKRGN